MNINQRLQEMLTNSTLTQKALSAYISVAPSTLNNWLKLGRSIPAEYIIPICEFFSVTPEYLLTGKEPEVKFTEEENQKKEQSDDKQRLLKMYDLLTPMEKGEILGELKAMTKNRTDIIQTVRAVARSKSNPFREAPTPEQIASFTPVPEDIDL